MIIGWIVALIAGIGVAAYASRRAVDRSLDIADRLGMSKGLMGVTIVAVGTDLPEIANSIVSSVTGHGDLVVGDATGSTLTQVTLILAILALTSRSLQSIDSDDQRVIVMPVGLMTVAATILIAGLIADGQLSRIDGAVLVALWAIGLTTAGRWQRSSHLVTNVPEAPGGLGLPQLFMWLAIVAGAATLVVQAFVRISHEIGVPELVAGTLVLALGTSLPELVVDWTAIGAVPQRWPSVTCSGHRSSTRPWRSASAH